MNQHALEEVEIKQCGSVDYQADDTPVCWNCGSAKLKWVNPITDRRNNDEVKCEICGGNSVTLRSAFLAEQLREAAK
jgi:hypothetical protein